jgi:hypothetical protein
MRDLKNPVRNRAGLLYLENELDADQCETTGPQQQSTTTIMNIVFKFCEDWRVFVGFANFSFRVFPVELRHHGSWVCAGVASDEWPLQQEVLTFHRHLRFLASSVFLVWLNFIIKDLVCAGVASDGCPLNEINTLACHIPTNSVYR